ncbi:peptidase domain-containing ABC transporter [Pedobacter psychrodurus]|uniref:peptidase domain-containing ABC transporter n=1 Tax=Pedobacter psychrodurus TaxID=2530456 RepID=UPI0029314237|nr:peptidase domain-containing ABC transporter [Pedobacter psychrodurus]
MLKSFPNELQYDKMDCGPTCLKIIAKYYGKFYSLHFLREKCGITKEGVSMRDLSYAAESIGLRSRSVRCSITDLLDKIPYPCILHWGGNHFVVLYKVTKTKVYVSDPAKGLIAYTYKEFSAKWIPKAQKKGVVMALEPQPNFHDLHVDEKANKRRTVSNILSYFTPYKKSFGNLIILMTIVTILQALLPFISKSIIDVGIQTNDLNFINIIVIANIIILISITLANGIRDWILQHLTSRINVALISDYLIKIMKLPITFFENKMIGDIIQRAQDHERIRNFIMNNSLNLLFSFLTFLTFTVILLIYNTIIFYIFLAGSIIYVGWVLGFLRLRKKLDWNFFELSARDQSMWIETINGIQDIKINNYEKAKRWKWENIQARLYKTNIRMQRINNGQNLGAQFIDNLKNLIITLFCARAVIAGEMTFGVMISTQIIIGMLNAPIQQFVQFVISAQTAKISFLRLNEIHKLEDEEEDTNDNDIVLPKDKSIQISGVSFQYSRGAPYSLQNITLRIPEKKITAIVGDSGSGKSTLMKLLLRLYKPSYGDILLGGMNVNNISLRQWRDSCGAVLQDGKIFNDTILNNIVLDDENIDYERLKNAVETANIGFEIESLPLGYKTKMGEQGRGLSGGQKQRILIARALYKNPEYLFFDEATNALDTINEQKIVRALDDVFRDKTVVVIAHRLSTIRKAHQIIVLKGGRIVEVGNHAFLMERKGHYFELVVAQTDGMLENINTTSFLS